MKTQMIRINDDRYEGEDGCVMAREYGKTPNGNNMNGRWVLREAQGAMVDFDQYSNDLAERNNLRIN